MQNLDRASQANPLHDDSESLVGANKERKREETMRITSHGVK